MSVDLDECDRRITETTQRETIKHMRRAPKYFEYKPLPLRVTQAVSPFQLGDFTSEATVDSVIYDFGAILVVYSFPIAGSFDALLPFSSDLCDNDLLTTDARNRVEELLRVIEPAVAKPFISEFIEDYAIYEIQDFEDPIDVGAVFTEHRQVIARILRSEEHELSEQEVNDAMSYQIMFNPDDVTIIDWNAAMIYARDAQDMRTVLEFANVELLEMRYLDQQLDDALDHAYRALSGRRNYLRLLAGRDSSLDLVAQLQVDSALLFEGVNNALKLLGDQYLARIYQAASKRFHMEEWDGSILRKLGTIESIYQKMNDRTTTMRMEVLEWIIIILIMVSIVLPFIPGYH